VMDAWVLAIFVGVFVVWVWVKDQQLKEGDDD